MLFLAFPDTVKTLENSCIPILLWEFYFWVTEADTNLNKFFYCDTQNTEFEFACTFSDFLTGLPGWNWSKSETVKADLFEGFFDRYNEGSNIKESRKEDEWQ